ncbi:hypothetical protein BgiBS90_001565 [Biomphalaria glabrata]|nr:hypothetical protein BgiBS90_001565 [Biomphalaria glabrata]
MWRRRLLGATAAVDGRGPLPRRLRLIRGGPLVPRHDQVRRPGLRHGGRGATGEPGAPPVKQGGRRGHAGGGAGHGVVWRLPALELGAPGATPGVLAPAAVATATTGAAVGGRWFLHLQGGRAWGSDKPDLFWLTCVR